MSASDEGREAADQAQVGFAEHRIQAMRAHPQIEAAMRHSVTRSVAYYDTAPVMHRNLKDVSRFLLGVVALYLDATGGLTHRRLRELSGQTGIVSAGTATALLLRLRLIGYVAPAETLPNGATRLYRPTAAMITAFRERFRIELEACALIDSRVAPVLDQLEEPEVFPHLMSVMGEDAINAARHPRADAISIDRLALRTAGMLIMFHLMLEADRGEAFPPVGEAQVSVSSLARRYEVSRSHVLTVLRDAEEMGLIVRLGEGRWRLEPLLGEVFRTFYAVLYLGAIKGARVARAAMVGDRAQP